MSVGLKLLAVATPIVGGGIVAPVYLLTANKNTAEVAPRLQESSSESLGDTSRKTEELKKVSCSSSDVVDGSALDSFLKEQQKDSKSYIYVSCLDVEEKIEKASPLGVRWTALFSKEVLGKVFSTDRAGKFEMHTQTIKGKEDLSDSVTIFTDTKKQSSIKVRWSNVLVTSHFSNDQTFLISIEGGEYTLRDAYLMIDSLKLTQQGR